MDGRTLLPETLFFGNGSRRLVRWLFLRALAVVAFLAFLSLYVQVHGLVGEQGILPVGEALRSASVQSPLDGFLKLPTLAWWFSGSCTCRCSWRGGCSRPTSGTC